MRLTRENVPAYYQVFLETDHKWEIIKYFLRRILGNRSLFDEDVKIIDGPYVFNCGRSIENCKVACSAFEKEFEKELHIERGIFVDIGAHIGKWTVKVGKKIGDKGKVIAIEADKQNGVLLDENMLLNKIENSEVWHVACSDTNGSIKFFNDEHHPARNSTLFSAGEKGYTVKAKTLDSIIRGRKVDLIKIDVEGAENLVLMGGIKTLKRSKPRILFEAWNEDYLKLVLKVILPLGYKIRRIGRENYVATIK